MSAKTKNRAILVIAIVLGIVGLLIIAFGIWYVRFGPVLEKKVTQADHRLRKADDLFEEAIEIWDVAEKTTSTWHSIDFDPTYEIARIEDDIAADRTYNIDEHRDQDAADVAKDIDDLLSQVKKATKQLKESSDEVNEIETGSLPSQYADYVDLLKKRNKAAQVSIDQIEDGLIELKKDIDVYGFYALFLISADKMLTQIEHTENLINAKDYTNIDESISEANSELKLASFWLILGNAELTNVGTDSKDAEAFRNLISKAKTVLSLIDQVVVSGRVDNTDAYEPAKIALDVQLEEIKMEKDTIPIDGSYTSWFRERTKHYQARSARSLEDVQNLEKKVEQYRKDNQID